MNTANTKRVWYAPKTDAKSPDAVHQALMFGTLSEIELLKKAVGEATVKELFLQYPKKIYTASALNFIKKFVLDIHYPIDEQRYLKYTPRNIG